MKGEAKFDVALSFAGEERPYVDRVANLLRERGVKVFYDLFEEVDLWGKDLYEHLIGVYKDKARFTVMFISSAYGKKLWTNHERRAAQARAFQEAQEYILPARFDDTEIPGVLPTIGYVSLNERPPENFVSLITAKLVSSGATVPSEYVRKDFSAAQINPTAMPTQLNAMVLDDEGEPIENCQIVAVAENNTTLSGRTNAGGLSTIEVNTRRIYDVLVSHPMFPATFVGRVDPANELRIVLPRTENVGSVIMFSTGYLPGLSGRLNPILDANGRRYLYADNIAINGGIQQPAGFSINEPIELEDAGGNVTFMTVKHIAGRTSLVQYLRRP